MTQNTTPEKQTGLFLYVTPVSGVHLGKSTSGEYRIDKVTLYSAQRFTRLRKYKFVYRKWRESAAKSDVLTSTHTVAVVKAGGDPDKARRYAHNLIKEELNILSSARLNHSGRDRRGVVGIYGCMDSYDTEDILLGMTVDLMQTSSRRHAPDQLRITDEFINMPDRFFPYHRLLWLLRGNGTIDDKWRKMLRNVAVLVGRSQNSIELPEAFLWAMIALEQLLVGADERSGHLEKLDSRCQSLFGHCPLWDRMNLSAALHSIYRKRCSLVHEGNRSGIMIGDVIAADLILSNVIGNVVFNAGRISSKAKLIAFAEEAKARALLNMPPRERKWHWHFSNLCYTESRLKSFWAL